MIKRCDGWKQTIRRGSSVHFFVTDVAVRLLLIRSRARIVQTWRCDRLEKVLVLRIPPTEPTDLGLTGASKNGTADRVSVWKNMANNENWICFSTLTKDHSYRIQRATLPNICQHCLLQHTHAHTCTQTHTNTHNTHTHRKMANSLSRNLCQKIPRGHQKKFMKMLASN